MASLLLPIIYLAFISLGLPDSLLGVPLCLTSSDYLDFKPYFICDLEAPHA